MFKLDIYYQLFIDMTVCTSQHRNSQLCVLFDGCCTCQFMAHLAVASWAVVWVQKALKLKCIMVLVHVFGQVFFLRYSSEISFVFLGTKLLVTLLTWSVDCVHKRASLLT